MSAATLGAPAPGLAAARSQEVGALSMRYFRRFVREKYTLGFTLLQPMLWLVLFAPLFSRVNPAAAAGAAAGGSYLDYFLPGVLVMNVLGAGLAAGIEVMFDKETGFLQRLLACPISRGSVIASRLIYVVATALLQVAVLLVVALAMGARFGGGIAGVAVVVGLAALLAVALGALSLMMAFTFHSHQEFFAVIGAVNMPLLFLSSAIVPLAAMPGWMQLLARANPLTYIIDVGRGALVQGVPWGALPESLAVLLATDAVLLVAAARVFRRNVE